MTRRGNGRLRVASLAFALMVPLRPAAASSEVHLTPQLVDVGAFFAGASVRVSGEIPAGSEAIVEVLGRHIEEQLLRKGRHWEIWMTVGEIDIEDAPCLYFALSTDPGSFSRADTQFGYGTVQKRTSFVGDVEGMKSSEIFRQFVELKEDEKLYELLPGALRVTRSSGEHSTVEGTFRIPSRVTPGTYDVRLSILNRGRVIDSESASLDVRLVGLPAFLASLSREHGALYGLLAVAIAGIVGFLVGVVFKRKRGV